MLEQITEKIEGEREKSLDVSLLLAYRAQLLLESQGGLGSAFLDCEEILENPNSKSTAKASALSIRALILSFLGVDELAEQDLQRKSELGFLEFPVEPREDCPAAFICSAADWHRIRRFAMLRLKPELKSLCETNSDVYKTCLLVYSLIAIHLYFIWMASVSKSLLFSFVCSSSVGAICCYGFQALTHELGHMAFHTKVSYWIPYLSAAAGSSFTNFIWHYYYWNYHNRHHAHAGGERDRDGDILFHAWQSPPILSIFNSFYLDLSRYPITRYLWTGFFSFFIYPMFCYAKYTLDSPHRPTFYYEGWNLSTHLLVMYTFGFYGYFYLFFSAAFSLGAFGHPFIQFWLTQHAFIPARRCNYRRVQAHANKYMVPLIQPTNSYRYSTSVWNAFNFGELRHVEHHDFPFIPYLRNYRVPEICPEFYSSLESSLSPQSALFDWIFAGGENDKAWMKKKGDFAGRTFHLEKLYQLLMEEEKIDDGQEIEEGMSINDEEAIPKTIWRAEDDVDDEEVFVRQGFYCSQ